MVQVVEADSQSVVEDDDIIERDLGNKSIPGKNIANGNFTQFADGGSRAWMVMLGSFFCNGILFGVVNSYGVLYVEFHENLRKQNVTNAPGKAGKGPEKNVIWNHKTN